MPVFPLPNVWLYPSVFLPLHVFEPRYRQMIEDSLDGPGRLVIGTVVQGHDEEMPDSPPIYPVAGLGEIMRHEKLANGRFNIGLLGLFRVRLEEVPSGRLYRTVRVEPAVESESAPESNAPLKEQLKRAVLEGRKELPEELQPDPEVLEKLPLGCLADLLTAQIEIDRPVRQEIFETLDTSDRARRVLSAYASQREDDDASE